MEDSEFLRPEFWYKLDAYVNEVHLGDYENFKKQLQPTCRRLQLALGLLNIVRCFPEEKWMFIEKYDFACGDFACGEFRREVWGKKLGFC
jgi:hypothetical protein